MIVSLTSLSGEHLEKLRDSPLHTTAVDFYPSINVIWIILLVFQMPDGNRFAKEIGLEYGFY